MTYVSGFLAAVPAANKQDYLDMAAATWPIFKDYGAVEMRECWGNDVPDGKVTSFPMAVKLEAGEVVVFSWIVWTDKADSDRCHASMETDPRWKDLAPDGMPFDGKRMIFGGFDVVFEGE